MQSYLLVGGHWDGLSIPAPDEQESVQMPVGVTDNETHIRDTLTVGDASITFYRHESLTPEQVLDQIVTHYKAWAVNRPGSRL
jgi:hypothetical protein